MGSDLRSSRSAAASASGIVASVGRDVTKFQAGDAVFAFPGVKMGCHAESRCMAQDAAVALKPANVRHAQAAALSFGATTALHLFRKAGLGAGKSVLVNGAWGAVGTAAIQLAKHFGAEVTAVCSGRNAALVTSLGADHVIDYTTEDFTRNGRAYDVIMDTAGTAPFARSRASLRDGGRSSQRGRPRPALRSARATRSPRAPFTGLLQMLREECRELFEGDQRHARRPR